MKNGSVWCPRTGNFKDEMLVSLGKGLLIKSESVRCPRMGDFRDERVVLGKVD